MAAHGGWWLHRAGGTEVGFGRLGAAVVAHQRQRAEACVFIELTGGLVRGVAAGSDLDEGDAVFVKVVDGMFEQLGCDPCPLVLGVYSDHLDLSGEWIAGEFDFGRDKSDRTIVEDRDPDLGLLV